MVNNRRIENPGRLVTYRSDFEGHWQGDNFRHTADDIDMNPALVYAPPVPPATTVQGTLENLLGLINNGNDFVSIGDGNISNGSYTVNAGYTTIETAFDAAIAALRFSASGGIILLKSGHYNFTNTVVLPAGISVIGEIGGTMINAVADNPIFQVEESPNFPINLTPTVICADGYRISKFQNLTFFDNYGQNSAVLTATNSCFLLLNQGSNVEIDKCSFFGKFSGPGSSTTITRQVLRLNVAVTNYNTILSFKNSTVFSTQQILKFNPDLTKDNRLTFSNNRVWCSGVIDGVLLTDTSLIPLYGCNSEFCNNDITFGLSSTAQAVKVFAYCYSNPQTLCTMIITGNKIKAADNTLIDQNSLFSTIGGVDAGKNIRSVITGNTCPSSNDSNSWYLVVGDGTNSIGDINGPKALSYIYEYYKQENDSGNKFHGQITIFVRYGEYTVVDGSFTTEATNFNFKLIGLPENGNLPVITFNFTAPTINGQNIFLGSHIENISFRANNKFYNICPTDYFTDPNPGAPFAKYITVKNCSFKNCGILLQSNANIINSDCKGLVNFENCRFDIGETLLNISNTNKTAISCLLSNYKLIINSCYTQIDTSFGSFLKVIPLYSPFTFNNDIEIKNCIIYSKGQGSDALLLLYGIRSIIVENNIFDISKATTSALASIIQATAFINNFNEPLFAAHNNKFIQAAAGTTSLFALNLKGFSKIDISNNIYKNCALANFIDMNISAIGFPPSSIIYPYNINVSDNLYVSFVNSYGFLSIRGGDSTDVAGTINVCNNTIDMSLKAEACNRYNDLLNYYNGNITGVIGIDLTDSDINISGNTISKFKTNQTDVMESLIYCLKYKNANIHDNKIALNNLALSRKIYSIYVSKTDPLTPYTSNNDSISITNNIITHYDAILSDYGIYAQYTKFVNIKGNNIKGLGGSLKNFITAFGDNTDNGANIGEITGNIIYSDSGTHENNSAIVYTNPDWTVPFNFIKLTVNKNKGQICYKDIECYEFVKYGADGALITGQQYDGYPEIHAGIFVNNKAVIFNSSDANNLNKSKQMDIFSIKEDWSDLLNTQPLPNGIYYSNINENALDARLPYGTDFGRKHQLVIPINIDDFVRLVGIQIPIYLYNNSTSMSAFEASCSLVISNTVDEPARIECAEGSSAPLFLDKWEYYFKSFASTGQTGLHTFDHPTLSSKNIWLTPKRNTSINDYTTPSSKAYIVLAMTAAGVASYPDTSVYFAIPYARIAFTY
ncbi:MAG: hypothetical protein ACOYMA_00650 [Bacteroidia bacterium]